MIEKAGGQGLFVQSDVSDETQIKSLVETVTKEFGRLDIAFNNAGIGVESFAISQATADQYSRVFDINVKGVFLAMKHEKRKYYAHLHPVGRFGRAEEVANAVLFLSSPGASFITGHDLVIDGGYTIQ
jgi:NAD(P)-dependent dehydrogenase (short-subunit alcohol dehydrogenase family)